MASYRPILELGRGGTARVYLGERIATGIKKLVVLKVLNDDLAADPEMRAAFRREAAITARLNHPNIVDVFEVFERGDSPILVMQYLDAVPLSDVLCKTNMQLPLKLHLYILTQVLTALHYVHELKGSQGAPLNCVHRDVSPHNVMVLHEGGVKVVDFGIAKVHAHSEYQTRAGFIKGKIQYMPPEQLLAANTVDRRADIYAAGVMLWEAVAKRRMWRGLDSTSIMRAVARGEAPKIREVVPSVPEALANVVDRALRGDRAERYQTAEEMQVDLQRAVEDGEGHARPRELAEFMQTVFGDERHQRQATIQAAMRDSRVSLHELNTHSNSPVVVEVDDEGSRTVPGSVVPIQLPWYRTRTAAVAAALVAAASATGLSSVFVHSEPRNTVEASGALDTVRIHIQTDPVGADIVLDGNALGRSPYEGTVPASREAASLELVAVGHQPQRRTVRLDRNLDLNVVLEPSEKPPEDATQEGEPRGEEKTDTKQR